MHRRSLQLASSSAPSRSAAHGSAPLVIKRHRTNDAPEHARPKEAKKLSDIDYMRKVTSSLVNKAARGESMIGWKHAPSRRGAQRRLRDAIPMRDQGKQHMARYNLESRYGQEQPRDSGHREVPDKIRVVSKKGVSNEQLEFLSQPKATEAYELDDGDTPSVSVSPSVPIGSYVEVRRNGSYQCGVKLHLSSKLNSERAVTLTSSGENWMHDEADIMFVIPGFAPRDLVDRCGWEHDAKDFKQKNARVEVLRRIREFERVVESSYNGMAQHMARLYNQFRSEDPNQWAQMSVAEAARRIDHPTIAPIVKMLCVHKHLMNRNVEFVAHPIYYRATQTFDVRPKAHVDLLAEINKMVRSKDPALDAFAAKVRNVIAASRRRAKLSYHEPAQRGSQHPEVEFVGKDRLIVDFLLASLHKRRFLQVDPFAVPLSAIVKKIDMFDLNSPVGSDLLYQLVIDLGLLAPWQDLASRERDADLDQAPDAESSIVKKQDAIVSRYLQRAPSPASSSQKAPLGREDFYVEDPQDSIRHDFGDMPVYVIDDAGAEELDDGVSIEAIPNEPNAHWVHVHIADPTAVIPPTHIFAQEARYRLQTSYFNHKTWPMMPRSLMQQSLSLGVKSKQGLPEQVLTFSAKIDSKGVITDTQVRAGLVRNIHTMLYDSINSEMGVPLGNARYPLGPPSFAHHNATNVVHSQQLTPKARSDLEDLFAVQARLSAARLKLPTFHYSLPKACVNMESKSVPSSSPDVSRPTAYRGFPELSFEVQTFASQMTGARSMVSEMMQVACRVASRFAQKMSIPAIHRVAGRIVTPTEEALEELLASRTDDGTVDFFHAMRLGAAAPAAQYSIRPGEHWGIGIPASEGYLRVTSPLRRYEDLVNHWQIKAALRTPKRRAFNPDWLTDTIADMTVRGQVKRSNEILHERFWILTYIRRWLDDPRRNPSETTLFNRLTARVLTEFTASTTTAGYSGRVYIEELGVLASMEASEAIPLGTQVKAKLQSVTVGLSPRMLVVPG